VSDLKETLISGISKEEFVYPCDTVVLVELSSKSPLSFKLSGPLW
jgi:hypothetical protein